MRLKTIGWLAAFCLAASAHVAAQEEKAPQVLTSDLALKQIVENDRLTVNFVIVDDDKIVKITIDGEAQEFEPSDTVLITKEFEFTPGRRVIRVVVEDEAGNARERTYLVAYQVPLEEEKNVIEEFVGFKVNVVAEVAIEIDDNPTQDLSLPVDVDRVGKIQGQVPDSEQTDTRTTLKALVTMGGGTWAAYAGVVDTSYGKEQNKFVESRAFFAGGQLRTSLLDGFLVGGTLSKVIIGGKDFVTQLSVAPGFEINTRDEGSTGRHLLELEITGKAFDDAERRNDFEYAFKWSLNSLDAARQDLFKTKASLGRRTEGTELSEFVFMRWDGDWLNRWDGGFRWDLGVGYQLRSYPNEKNVLTEEPTGGTPADDLFGDTRLDNIMRASTGVGWEFWKLSVMFNYRYLFNLSNNSPYVRQIYGLTVRGIF